MPSKAIPLHPHLSLEELEQRYRSCKDAREKTRRQVIWLYARQTRENRPGTLAVSRATGFSQNRACRLIRRCNAEGPEGLIDRHRYNPGGDKRALLSQQEPQAPGRALHERPPDGGCGRPPVKEHTGKTMAGVTAWTYLRRLGFTLQRPRPRHPRRATAGARAAFHKNQPGWPGNSVGSTPGERARWRSGPGTRPARA